MRKVKEKKEDGKKGKRKGKVIEKVAQTENINEDQIPQPFVTIRLPVTNEREPTERIKTGQDHPNVNLLSSLNLMQMFMLKKRLIDQLMNVSEIQEIMTEVTLRNVLSVIQDVYF